MTDYEKLERLRAEVAREQSRSTMQVGAGAFGAAAGVGGSVATVSVAGSVAGLSAAGVTSGLAAVGATVGGGMVAGVALTAAAPVALGAVAAGLAGWLLSD